MKIKYGNWLMRQWTQKDRDHRTTQVNFATEHEFEHAGHLCDGLTVSFASADGIVDIEVLAAQDGDIVSTLSLVEHLEQDDLILLAAKAIAAEVEAHAAA